MNGLTHLCTEPDISELNLAKGTSINFPQGKDKLLIFDITIQPDEGHYRSVQSAAPSVTARNLPR